MVGSFMKTECPFADSFSGPLLNPDWPSVTAGSIDAVLPPILEAISSS